MPSTTTATSLEAILKDARDRIEVTDDELDEAKKRRSAIAAALRRAFPGCRINFNGSIAHGDALTPLTDVDLGVVILDPTGRYGPGKEGPLTLMERARGRDPGCPGRGLPQADRHRPGPTSAYSREW